MTYVNPHALISTDDLSTRLGQSDLKIIDATYHIPPSPRDAGKEFEECHVPGAVFWNIDTIADPSTPLPHMLPTPEDFARHVGNLGIGNDDFVVVYDTHGLMSAPRVWWMFRVFGHERVAVLDGGLPKWQAEGRQMETGQSHPQPKLFEAHYRPHLVKTRADIIAGLTNPHEQRVDLRPTGRFQGLVPEPRPGLRSGHIPGSLNLPWSELIDPETKTFLPHMQVLKKFKEHGIRLEHPITCSCGSGVTACMGALGLYLLGIEDVAVYDGSWAEWGQDTSLPIEC